MPFIHQETLEDQTRVGIWEITESESHLSGLLELSPEELQSCNRRSARLKRMQFLAARAALQEMMGAAIHVHYRESGRPFVPASQVDISISHANNLVAVAVSQGPKVGIDIEKGLRPNLEKARTYFLSDRELQEIGEDASLEQLHIYWSAKEALYKYADCTGLSMKENLYIKPFPMATSGRLTGYVVGEVVPMIFRTATGYRWVVTLYQPV